MCLRAVLDWFCRRPFLGLFAACWLAAVPAGAAVSSFTASFATFLGSGNGVPSAPPVLSANGCPVSPSTGLETCSFASGHLVSYASTGFTLGAGVFDGGFFFPDATNQGGTVPLATVPGGIYLLGQLVNQSSAGGTLSAGAGPNGGFGGVLSTGGLRTLLFGTVPLPNVLGSIVVPSRAGLSGSTVATSTLFANAITVTVENGAWTTGTVTFDDTRLGTTNGSGTAVPDRFATAGTAMGSHGLGPNGGSIRLVAPVHLRITSSRNFPPRPDDLRAGYHVLELVFVPEPATGALLLSAIAVLLARAHRQRP